MKRVSNAQVRKLMEEMSKQSGVVASSLKAGMDRTTGRKYVALGRLPSELVQARDWRTREDPFIEHWEEVVLLLREQPGLEAKTLFEVLREKYVGRYEDGQLRTLQRRVADWRASGGPDQHVVFEQRHRPGEAAQTDFTRTDELAVTVGGALFVHLLCVTTLPFSNWQWATVCLSESMSALRRGVQRALFQLGRLPQWHQTDNSTAATHRIPVDKVEHAEGSKRVFNAEYLALMRHFSMTPRTTQVGAKEQNGDVEASNGAIKRRLRQALMVRGNSEFETVEQWQLFVDGVLRKANSARGQRVTDELAAMRELQVARLPEYVEEQLRVCERSTIRARRCAYSVPSRLIGALLRVRIYEDRIEAYHGDKLELGCERLHGEKRHRIDYHHVIWSLVQKPGAFARYVYREELFPSLVFRRAYDTLQVERPGTKGDLEYLRILHLAASTMESNVEAALQRVLEEGKPMRVATVKSMVTPERIEVPALLPIEVDLASYDALLTEVGA